MTSCFWPCGIAGLPVLRRYARAVLAALAVLFLLASAAAPARADDFQDANRLMRQGQHARALERINQYLASKPRDAQGRFLKGLILTEQNKNAEAIDIFTRLTQDYPELPEPYNNLAVLYAAQGQYEKARQSLEMSIRTHPSYATAYENLGDVYTKLASQAYDKALQLDSSNSGAKTKLSLVRDISAAIPRPAKPAAKPEAAPRTETARVEPPKSEPAKPAVQMAAAPKAVPSKPAAPEPRAAATTRGDAKPADGSDEVLKTVQAWAQAWSGKDVKGYLSFYARDFKTPKGESRTEWEKERAARINAPKDIDVSVNSPRVTQSSESTATVIFRQSYRSDRIKVTSMKTLVLVRSSGKWLIQQERVGS